MPYLLPYRQTVDGCLSRTIGQNGLTTEEVEALLQAITVELATFRTDFQSGMMPFLQLAEEQADLRILEPIAIRYRDSFDHMLILGTGGSSLGGRALYEMAHPKGAHDQTGPTLHIVTNVDPFDFKTLLQRLEPARTGVIAISKSGRTTETLMQLLSVLPTFRESLGEAQLRNHITLITEPANNPLRRLGERFDLPVLAHDPRVGGRYSVLSLVGMLPAMLAGLEPAAVRAGAKAVLRQALVTETPEDCPPVLGAAVAVGLNQQRNIHSSVMLAYSDRLGSLARWYRQLWAESLGKDGKGTTPIYGTGPVDQHSQLQLWLDGPADKMFTVLGGPLDQAVAPIEDDLASEPDLSFMAGRSLGDLMEASRRATAETLMAAKRPVRLIQLEKIDEIGMGALMMHFMLETVLSARLMKVDPFTQPAVEHGKVLIRQYLSEM